MTPAFDRQTDFVRHRFAPAGYTAGTGPTKPRLGFTRYNGVPRFDGSASGDSDRIMYTGRIN